MLVCSWIRPRATNRGLQFRIINHLGLGIIFLFYVKGC
jgi:hypothetical protein